MNVNDSTLKALGLGSLIVAAYTVYCVTNPGADGLVFASILAALSALITGSVVNQYHLKKKVQ